MSRLRERNWVVPVALAVSLLLGVMPLPERVQPFRPFWLALVLSYLVVELPERFGVGRAFALGLVADLLYGALLGEHALRLVILTFLLQRFRARLRFFPPAQQALVMGALLLNDRFIAAALHLLLGQPQLPLSWWWAPLPGMLLWPLVFELIDRLRQGRRSR